MNFHISAKRWFERTNGNTYHSVTIYQDGEEVAREPFAYGYGNQYEYTAADMLAGIVPVDRNREPLRLWAERAGFTYSIECTDVNRKRDL